MFWKNVEIRITAVAILLRQAEKNGVSNLAKSAYYRSATILIGTIVEGMVYHLVKKYTEEKGHIIKKTKELKKLHQIPNNVFQHEKDVFFICKQIESNVHIDDDGVSFARLDDFLLKNKVISKKEFEKLNYVRIERNKLHLQGLSIKDTGYTKTKFKKISEPMDFLTKKLSKYNEK